jgi:CheY-like chemotaxis protein
MEQYRKVNDLPALITIDINMPGMDGMKTLQELKKVLGDKYIPIIFLSTNIMHSELSFFDEQHVSILKKPNSLAGYDLIAETLVKSMLL